ncbi:universal stress protein UspE [Alteromonas oceanisediminis]|uniref:universal stress protein UspE n=1 Tax=Alteromonas oceanisediminis TaxID=2836180 RepID=UPI001BDA0655|nr:universal stress protein UspE [Alteromonas oceanisediminis]MBT0586326.1 universal stress protein UspE [Alteromonas oceanisediminis]
MTSPNHLLVVVDADATQQPALSRAVTLAKRSGAKITALLCIYDFAYEMTTMLSMDERDAMRKAVLAERHDWLSTVVEPYQADTNALKINVVWDNRQYEAIIKHADDVGADLIIKTAHSHDDLASLIFTPTDWHLLRKAPTPVLMVKTHDWPANGNILAAVNVGTQDEAHALLNHKVTNTATHYAQLLDGKVQLANAFAGAPINVAIEIPDFDASSHNRSVQQHHQQEMLAFAKEHQISPSCCHVEQGLPERVIPMVAQKVDAELVVIGTVGRVGLSAALIGNTAEHVIDALNCDVLAIKPDDFTSPINL